MASTPPPSVPPHPSRQDVLIDEQLSRARWQLLSVDVGGALLTLAVGSMAYLLVMVLIDHWVLAHGLSPAARLLAFALWVGVGSVYALRKLAPLVVRRINPLYAAQTIEHAQPTLKNSLINFLLLRARSGEVAPVIYEAVEKRAADDLVGMPVEATIDHSRLIKLGYVLLAIVVFACGYKLFSPKDPLRSLGRVMAPWANIDPPTRVRIESIDPGDTQVVQDGKLSVKVRIRGLRSGEPATLFYSTADAQVVDQPVKLESTDGRAFAAELPDSTSGLRQDIRYRIVAGDALSREYQVHVVTEPAIVVDWVEYKYPAYTKLAPRRVERQGDVQALEGTEVTVHARATHPIGKAHVDFDRDGKLDLPMSVRQQTAEATFTLRRRDGQSEHANYQLTFQTPSGERNGKPITYRIEVLPDLPPDVALVEPQADPKTEIALPVHGKLPLVFEASDPDFALNKLTLMAEPSGRPAVAKSLLAEPRTGKFRTSYVFDADSSLLGLHAGDLVEFWGVAEDDKQPEANRSETPHYKIRIASPDKRQDQLADARDQRKPDQPPPAGEQPPKNEPPPDQSPKQGPPKEGQEGDQPRDPNQPPPQPGDESGAKQPGQGQQGDRKQADQQERPVDPNSDPGKAIDEINRRFDEKPKDEQRPPNDKPQDDAKPEQSKGSDQSGQQGGAGQSSGDGQQGGQGKSGQQGKNDSNDQPPRGSQGDNQESSKGRGEGASPEHRNQPGDKQPSEKQQDGDQPQGESKGPHSGDRTGERRDTNNQSGPGQQKPQPGDQQKPGQSGGKSQPDQGTQPQGKSGQQKGPEQGQQGAGQQQPPGQGGKQPPGAGQQGQQPGEKSSGTGQQPGGQQGADQPQAKGQPKGQDKSQGQDQSKGQPGAADRKDAGKDGAQPAGSEKSGQPQGANQQPAGDQKQPPADPRAPGDQPGEQREQGGMKPGDEKPAGDKPTNQPDTSGKNQQQTGEKPGESSKSGQGDQVAQGADKKPAPQPEAKQPSDKPAPGGDRDTHKGPAGADNKSGSDQKTPANQEENSESRDKRQKADEAGQSKEKDKEDGKSPSRSKRESDSRGQSSGDQSGGGQQGGGQKANKPGTGGPGQNTASDDGASKARQQGQGETGSKAGQGPKSDKPTGQSSKQDQGAGSKQQPGGDKPDGEKSGEGQQGQPAQPPGKSDGQSKPGPGERGHGPGGGGKPDDKSAPPPPAEPREVPPGEDPNLDYARKATDLALERLKSQLAKPKGEQDLLDKLNWSREDAERFVRRWEEMKRAAREPGAAGQAGQRQLDDALRNLGLRPRGTVLGGGKNDDRKRNLRQGLRTRPPSEYAEQYRAYTTATSQAQPAASGSSTPAP